MSVTEARAHFVCGTPQLTVWDFACARTTRTSTVWNVSCSVRTPLSSCHSQNLRKTKITDPWPKKKKKKKKRRNSRDINQRRSQKRSKIEGLECFSTKRDNQFVVKDETCADDFCHLASLYYIKVVNRIIKRATFSSTFVALFYDYPLRPSLYRALTLCLLHVCGWSFSFFLSFSLSFFSWLEHSTKSWKFELVSLISSL